MILTIQETGMVRTPMVSYRYSNANDGQRIVAEVQTVMME